jgi:hypothetical protein
MYTGRRLVGGNKSSSGQAPVLAAVLFLLLVPTTIILAENATDNATGLMTANISPLNATLVGQPNATPSNTTTTNTTENDTNTTTPPVNLSVLLPPYATNETDHNATTTDDSNTTATDNENATIEENTALPPEPVLPLGPILEVELDVPDRVNRNEEFTLNATVTNTGDVAASDVEIEWVLPEDLHVIWGSGNQTCDIPSAAACQIRLRVTASISSILGERDIRVIARYLR